MWVVGGYGIVNVNLTLNIIKPNKTKLGVRKVPAFQTRARGRPLESPSLYRLPAGKANPLTRWEEPVNQGQLKEGNRDRPKQVGLSYSQFSTLICCWIETEVSLWKCNNTLEVNLFYFIFRKYCSLSCVVIQYCINFCLLFESGLPWFSSIVIFTTY